MRKTITATAVAAAALILSACGEAGGDSTSADEDLTIGVANLGLSFPFPSSIGEGIKAKADELGVEIVELDGQGKTEKQANDVQDLINQQPDGVLLLPVDSGVAVGMADQLEAADIPTVAVASQVGDPTERDLEDVYDSLVALATQQELDAGSVAGELAIEAVPDGGKLAVVEGAAGAAEVELRWARFLDPAEEADIEFDVVARQPGDWTTEGAQSACQNMLSSDPDIDLFYAESDDMAVGCANAVESAGSDAEVVGIGGSKLGVDGVDDEKIYGTVCFKPRDLGELAMQTIYDHLTGESTQTAQFVTYETPAISKDNIDDCDPQW